MQHGTRMHQIAIQASKMVLYNLKFVTQYTSQEGERSEYDRKPRVCQERKIMNLVKDLTRGISSLVPWIWYVSLAHF